MQTMTANEAAEAVTAMLAAMIRALESPLNWMAIAGRSAAEQQAQLDLLCAELGRRGEG